MNAITLNTVTIIICGFSLLSIFFSILSFLKDRNKIKRELMELLETDDFNARDGMLGNGKIEHYVKGTSCQKDSYAPPEDHK